MDIAIDELKNKYNINIILKEQSNIILDFSYNNESIIINITYDNNFPKTIPQIKIMNENKYMKKGYLPNEFEMESLDTKWKYNLICIFDEIVSTVKSRFI